jgi:cytochrome-b5 reductase
MTLSPYLLFRFSVTHVLSNADKSWAGMRGRIGETVLRNNLPVVNGKNHQKALVCVCGPEQFTQGVVK